MCPNFVQKLSKVSRTIFLRVGRETYFPNFEKLPTFLYSLPRVHFGTFPKNFFTMIEQAVGKN